MTRLRILNKPKINGKKTRTVELYRWAVSVKRLLLTAQQTARYVYSHPV